MNVENVSTAANWFSDYAAKKSKGSMLKFFIPQIDEPKPDNLGVENAHDVDAVSVMESMTGKIALKGYSYSVTDEEAEYFREKYGDTYNDDVVHKLYYELMDKGIISMSDAGNASGVLGIMPLSAVKSISYIGSGLYGSNRCVKVWDNPNYDSETPLSSKMVFAKDVSRTDKDSPYKSLWDSFKKTYDREINTWEDALQKNIDFERYVKENKSNADYLFRQHCDKVIEALEKTKDIITKIFG